MTWRTTIAGAGVLVLALSGCNLRGGGSPTSSEPTPRPVYARTVDQPLAAPAGGVAPTAPPAEVPTVPTPGRTIVVATNGKDDAPGTVAAPMRTIGKAIERVEPGDTILVRAGRYPDVWNEANAMFRDIDGRPDAWIKLAAYPGERPVLEAIPPDDRYVLWRSIGVERSSYIEVRGFDIVGTALTTQQPTAGFEVRESHHVRMIDNVMYELGGGGVSAIHSNHLVVIGNVVHTSAYWNEYQTSGISSFQADNVGGPEEPGTFSIRIERNIVHSVENRVPNAPGMQVTDGNCIIIDIHDERAYTGNTLVANNVCFNNGGRGINVLRSKNVLAVNNTLRHNLLSKDHDDEGELSVLFASNVRFVNNIIEPAPSRKAVVLHDTDRVTFERNLFVGKGQKKRGPTDLTTAGPVYADPGRLDFRLLAGTPAVGAATPRPEVPGDFYGAPRAATTDLGALPAVAAGASRPTSG
jgi:parallel beta-helix repeat protein